MSSLIRAAAFTRYLRRRLQRRARVWLFLGVCFWLVVSRVGNPSTANVLPRPFTPRRSMVYDRTSGLISHWDAADPKHPIEYLMENGKRKWEGILSRQSKTLASAIQTYKDRYHMSPPKGFDGWFHWAMEHDVTIIDDYDQIHRDTQLYHAISPSEFRRRREAVSQEKTAFVLHLGPNTPIYANGGMPNFRATDLTALLATIGPLLPLDTTMVVSTDDVGISMIGDDQRTFLQSALTAGKFVNPESDDFKWLEWPERYKHQGLEGIASACPEDSPAWRDAKARHDRRAKPTNPLAIVTPEDKDQPTFIYNQRLSNDFCYSQDLKRLHGALSYDHARSTTLRPIFHQSKLSLCPDLLLTPLDHFANASADGPHNQFLPWEQKKVNKVQWRGKSTGVFHSKRSDYNWRNSHRTRLHNLAQTHDGHAPVYVKNKWTNGWRWQTLPRKSLNEAYFDVGLTDGPFQCDTQDGTCDTLKKEIGYLPRMDPKEAAVYKYVLDVDGNGWSSRFQRLLLSGSVVLKSTIYSEWFSDWLVPWYHYVPIQASYSELYSVLSFFIGVPGTMGSGRDDLARTIGRNGRTFAEKHWRWEDMQSYMFRMLLEYIRLEQDDRAGWACNEETGTGRQF